MSDPQRVKTGPSTVNRRKFLTAAGAGVAGGSLLTMLEARQAPAQIKGGTLRILTWSHFIPAYDVWFDKFSGEWGDKNGVKVRVDHIPHLEIPARMAAEFAAGAGHDIILNNSTILARLYYKSLLDLTDVYDGLGKKHGGWIPAAKSPIEVEGHIYGIPMYYILLPMLWRKDLFEANGLKPPDTWELARVAARTLKPKGSPTGMAFSHCNDANLNWRSLMFSFGATETDASGDHPTIDSKEMREALRFAKALFDEGMTPEVFSWDDASDNRFLASGIASWIHDAISAYRTTEDTNPDVFKNTHIAMEPAGPGGTWNVGEPNVWAVWKFSKNIPAAKEFIMAVSNSQKEAMGASRGYNMPFLRRRYEKPMPGLGQDAKLSTLQEQDKITAFFGHPGPMTPAAQEVLTTFIVPDMFTRVARGSSIDETVKWGVGEIRRIYAKHKAT